MKIFKYCSPATCLGTAFAFKRIYFIKRKKKLLTGKRLLTGKKVVDGTENTLNKKEPAF